MLRTLVLVTALLGLMGEGAAIAAAPVATHRVEAAATMSAECMDTMPDSDSEQSPPCDGTFKCMLAMGCISLNLMAEATGPQKGEPERTVEEYWPAVATLRGASFAPEPEPPTTFG